MGLILIVEDDREARRLLRSVIALDGHEAATCGAAEEVEQTLDGRTPDLAILDIGLPREHGVSLAWRLRARWPALPILIVSAMLERWDDDDLADCGVDAALGKPFDIDTFQSTLRRLLATPRHVSRQGETR